MGPNDTTKGVFLFDTVAADAVMTAYRAHGVDLAIDLEHESVDELALRPDSRDARGYAKLEVRDGELWAVGVEWNADGAARISERRQKYISPYFEFDSESGRITRVINMALTSQPATHSPQALAATGRAFTGAARARAGYLLARMMK